MPTKILKHCALMLLVATASFGAVAGEEKLQLKPGPERDTVLAHCSMCHSVDVILMNSTFMKRKQWEATVVKMRKAMQAPIPDEAVAPIVEYLTRNYGVPD
jgi:hypothetical protein